MTIENGCRCNDSQRYFTCLGRLLHELGTLRVPFNPPIEEYGAFFPKSSIFLLIHIFSELLSYNTGKH
jgi:hypothetical protein